MIAALAFKEVRELRAFVALALAVYLVCVGSLTGLAGEPIQSLTRWLPGIGGQRPDVPFVQGSFPTTLGFLGIALAITLGFRQSAWEPSQGTALYLLHLPLSRRSIILTKFMTGITLLLACALSPILLYGAWAATPGTHPGPFEWSMTESAFRIWVILPLVYLGAFASGIRPARWFGSRLSPLVAVVPPALFVASASPWWLWGFPTLVLAAAVLGIVILHESETRDY